jgi:hypothetical protein
MPSAQKPKQKQVSFGTNSGGKTLDIMDTKHCKKKKKRKDGKTVCFEAAVDVEKLMIRKRA